MSKLDDKAITTLYKNVHVFDVNYVPPAHLIVHRDEEIKHIADHLWNVRIGTPSDLTVLGAPGSGKTMVVQSVIKDCVQTPGVADRAKFVYVNCREHNTPPRVFACIDSQLFPDDKMPSSGLAIGVYIERMEKFLVADRTLVVVLDEVDVLLKHPTGEDAIYALADKPNVASIYVSNNVRWKDRVKDPRTRSRMGDWTYTFGAYDVCQIHDILSKRAETGLKGGVVDDDVLEQISMLNFQEYGDMRKAIQLLKACVDVVIIQGHNKVTNDDLRTAIERLDNDAAIDLIKTLPSQQQALLSAIFRASRQTQPPWCYSNDAKRLYRNIAASHKLRPLADPTLRTYVGYFKEYGLIDVEEGGGRGRRRGRAESKIFPKFDLGGTQAQQVQVPKTGGHATESEALDLKAARPIKSDAEEPVKPYFKTTKEESTTPPK